MMDIFRDVGDHLFGIAGNVFYSMKNDLLIPQRRKTPEELLRDKVRSQFATIRSLQDQLSLSAGTIQELRRELQDKNDLLDKNDKEIKLLKERIKSSELQQSRRTKAPKRRR